MIDRVADSYRRLRRYLHNTLWILAERSFGLILGLVATAFVARHLGPQDYGALAYALSLVALFAVAGHLGLSGLVVREIVRRPAQRGEILGTVVALKSLGLLAGYVALLIYAACFEGNGSQSFVLIAVAGVGLLFRPSEVFVLWFEARVQARYAALAGFGAQLLGTLLKLLLVAGGASVVAFAAASALQALLLAAALLCAFMLRGGERLRDWHCGRASAQALLSQGWMVFLATVFAVIYLKIDQVMLRWMVGVGEVGHYAVAAQISEAWFFVPNAIVASVYPQLIALRERDSAVFHLRLQQLFDMLFSVGLAAAVLVSICAPWLIELLFGAEYGPSAAILVVHVWSGIFVCMRAAVSRWILIENVLAISLLTQGSGALVNVALNWWLIPQFGGLGAAYATLVAYATASFLSLALFRRTRPVFWLMARAVLAPLRYAVRLTARA